MKDKIVTVTFNPTIDKSTTVKAMIPEKKLRCSEPRFEPGGGGINVARAILKLGGNATAVFPAGGYSGKYLVDLMGEEGVPVSVVETGNHTRENLIVLDTSSNQQYRFGMPGPRLGRQETADLMRIIRESGAGTIVASGSLPPDMDPAIFMELADLARAVSARLVVDTSGEGLKAAAKTGVFMLKPNLGELSSLVGKEELNHEEVNDVAREIITRGGAEVILVSMGGSGASLITRDEAFHATPPMVRRKSTVGAGDSMVAGAVMAITSGKTYRQALDYGVAAGTAATMNPGTELCRPEDTERLYRIISSGG